MSCRNLCVSAFVLIMIALMSVGCTTTADYSLGAEYVPTNQNMELRRRVYREGKMFGMDGDVEQIAMAKTFLHQNDSIKSSNLDNAYFGYERSELFGVRKAGFMTQVLFGSKLDEDYGWGYRPIFDSMTLVLYVNDYHGDTTKKRRYGVYEITSNDYLKSSDVKDSVFYTQFKPQPYISQEPIFEFTYPNQERGVYVGDLENPQYCSITLDPTATTDDYIRTLMFTTADNLEANDNYAVDSEKIYKKGNEDKFVEKIKGVYIAPIGDLEGDDAGAMIATELENSALVLYARSRYKEDPTIIKDTVIMSYNFYISPTDYGVKAGNMSITNVERELSEADKSAIENRTEVLYGKVDAMAGVVTELEFTDDFLRSLSDVADGRTNVRISVNQAHLNIYLKGGGYDYNFSNPLAIAEIMDGSMARMGLYARYGGYDNSYQSDIIAIADYLYAKESSNFAIPYDGYLNRSLACYTMDISNFMQSLIMSVLSTTKEDGTVDIEEFRNNEELNRSRRLYIGPAANALFGFKHQEIVGGDDVEVDGVKSESPITLELVYTIVD